MEFLFKLFNQKQDSFFQFLYKKSSKEKFRDKFTFKKHEMTADIQELHLQPTFKGGVPVFRPRIHDFLDFNRLIAYLEPFGAQYGLVKVVAPKEWSLKVFEESCRNLYSFSIQGSIKQRFKEEYKDKRGHRALRQTNTRTNDRYSGVLFFFLTSNSTRLV